MYCFFRFLDSFALSLFSSSLLFLDSSLALGILPRFRFTFSGSFMSKSYSSSECSEISAQLIDCSDIFSMAAATFDC